MLGVALKNLILVVLIILIIHFLLKVNNKETYEAKSVPAPIEMPHASASTCDPQLEPIKSDEKQVTSNCVLDQPNPNAFLVLKEYDQENPMNTQKWLDNIDLYDEFGSIYSSYNCGQI